VKGDKGKSTKILDGHRDTNKDVKKKRSRLQTERKKREGVTSSTLARSKVKCSEVKRKVGMARRERRRGTTESESGGKEVVAGVEFKKRDTYLKEK